MERIAALDSMRGIAAVIIIIYHSITVYPQIFQVLDGAGRNAFEGGGLTVFLLTTLPPSLLWSGREAVLFFFALSGFVLTLPFMTQRPPRYVSFLLQRFVRLLPPCVFTVLVIVALMSVLPAGTKNDTPMTVLDYCWFEAPDLWMVLKQAFLIGDFYSLNPVLWTLHYEWHASIVFPLLVLLTAAGTRLTLAVMLLGTAVAYAELRLTGRTGYAMTLYYLPYFALGSLLARHRAEVRAWVARLSDGQRIGLWVGCYILLKFRWLVPAPAVVDDLVNGAGAALLIALVISSPAMQALLMRGPLPWLGKVSFSLYLVHLPVILILVSHMPAEVPLPVTLLLAATLSFALAALMFRTVELPCIQLSRRIAKAVARPASEADQQPGEDRTLIQRA
ncbi:acyltransferase family protein [Falsiroseomonas tokyonensis]|nr:acyltransferase [Falsiroseomonas tokyonensis]